MFKLMNSRALAIVLSVAMVFGALAGMTVVSSADTITYTEISDLSGITSMSGNYKLTSNVTISAGSWTPIGTSSAPFTGTFDGGGKTITWSGTTTSESFAIFAVSNGTIQNLNVAGTLTSTTNGDYVAAVVANNSGTIDKVTSTVTLTAATAYNVGGIAGYSTGYILNSTNSGAVTGYSHVGGVTGQNHGTINSCANTATVESEYNGKGGTGGIAGFNGDKSATTTGHIWNCYNTAAITAGTSSGNYGSWAGGICGFLNSKSDCTNCYNTGKLTAYNYRDHISGKTEGTNSLCYGPNNSTLNAQGSDGATLLTATQMTDGTLYNKLNNASSGSWTNVTSGYPVLAKTATTTSSKPAAQALTFEVTTQPTKTTYTEGETFETAGMVISAVDADGNKTAITEYSYTPSGALTTDVTTIQITGTYNNTSYILMVAITVNPSTAKTIYLNGLSGAGSDEYDGLTSGNPVATLAKAVSLAGTGGKIYVTGAVTLPEGTQNGDVTVYNDTGGTMFNVTTGTARLTSMTIDGGGYTIFNVTGGTLQLRGNIKLQNCATAVLVNGGTLEVNKASITANTRSVDLQSGSFILNDFGGTSISGTVYLASGKSITVGAAIPTTGITVTCADASVGRVIAIADDDYGECTTEDEGNVTSGNTGYSVTLNASYQLALKAS